MKKLNTTFNEAKELKKEFSKESILGLHTFLEELTDGNYHDLRNEIIKRILEEVNERNKKNIY